MATQKDLVKNLVAKIEYLSEEDTKEALEYVVDYIKNELAKDNRIEIRRFGSMSVREKKFANQDKKYKTIYFRPAKTIVDQLKHNV